MAGLQHLHSVPSAEIGKPQFRTTQRMKDLVGPQAHLRETSHSVLVSAPMLSFLCCFPCRASQLLVFLPFPFPTVVHYLVCAGVSPHSCSEPSTRAKATFHSVLYLSSLDWNLRYFKSPLPPTHTPQHLSR